MWFVQILIGLGLHCLFVHNCLSKNVESLWQLVAFRRKQTFDCLTENRVYWHKSLEKLFM